MRQTISACLVVRDEERIIRRCLDSIRGVVDEIIVVHDGECKDRTLAICQEYTPKVFVRPRIGEAEPHRVFSFEQATGQWILWIDADEYLSDGLRASIRELVECDDVDLYCFLWPYTDGKRLLTLNIKHPYRGCLARRSRLYFYGLPHDAFRTYGRQKKISHVVVHQPDYNAFTLHVFRTKMLPWARLRARLIWKDPQEIPCFGVKDPDSFRQYLDSYRRRPLSKVPAKFFYQLGWHLYKGMWKLGPTGLWISIFTALNVASTYYFVYKYRPRTPRSRGQGQIRPRAAM